MQITVLCLAMFKQHTALYVGGLDIPHRMRVWLQIHTSKMVQNSFLGRDVDLAELAGELWQAC